MLKHSTRGLVFSGATGLAGRRRRSSSVVGTSGPERVGHLFKLLGLMANAPDGEWETVASEWMGSPDDDGARSAGEAGLNYIFSNLTGDIRLTTAARLAYMSEPTFSKYFKRATGLTFSNMVKKLRVAHARRLLDSTDHPSPGWPRSAATTTWPTSTASSWPRWAARHRPTGAWSRRRSRPTRCSAWG